ncbi:hypothetical protein TNCV_1993861 [Trichonephila clavipes]|nr:hypothetical protein TNCV_1993861 [Trichonephila clavipes]
MIENWAANSESLRSTDVEEPDHPGTTRRRNDGEPCAVQEELISRRSEIPYHLRRLGRRYVGREFCPQICATTLVNLAENRRLLICSGIIYLLKEQSKLSDPFDATTNIVRVT